MLSFLTQDYKKMVQREYLFRFLTVVFVVLTVLAVVAGLILVPYIMFVSSQQAISVSRLASLSSSSQVKDAQAFRMDLGTLRSQALRLTPSVKALPYELISGLSGLLTQGVQLSSIGYSLNQDGTVALSLSGVAATRSSLQTFVASLQSAKGLSGVAIPVSAFAQDKNIGFNLNMTALSTDLNQ